MKAILIIDESQLGWNCPCLGGEQGECQADDPQYRFCDGYKKSNWCPFKEMPKKRGKMFLTERSQEDTDLMIKSAFANCYTDGWNDCLGEIEK